MKKKYLEVGDKVRVKKLNVWGTGGYDGDLGRVVRICGLGMYQDIPIVVRFRNGAEKYFPADFLTKVSRFTLW